MSRPRRSGSRPRTVAGGAAKRSTDAGARRRRRLLIVLAALLVAVAGLLAWRNARVPSATLPDLDAAEPAVAAAIAEAWTEVRAAPESSDAWGRLGSLLLAHNYRAEAEAALGQAERLDPDEARWPYLQALAKLRQQPPEALPPLRRAVERSPDDPSLRGQLADTLLELGETEEAAAHYRRLLEGGKRSSRAHLNLARIAAESGEVEEAIEHLQATRNSPYARKQGLQLLAQLHLRQADEEAAQAAAQQAEALPPDRPWPDPYAAEAYRRQVGLFAQLERAGELREQGRAEQSQQMMTAAERQHPHLYWLLEGRLCLDNGDLEAARNALQKSVELAPEFIEAHHWLGQAQLAASRPAEAVAAFQRALELEPSYGPAHLGLARARLEVGDETAAEVALRQAVRYMPTDAEAHRQLSELLADRDPQAAARHRRLSEKLAKQNP